MEHTEKLKLANKISDRIQSLCKELDLDYECTKDGDEYFHVGKCVVEVNYYPIFRSGRAAVIFNENTSNTPKDYFITLNFDETFDTKFNYFINELENMKLLVPENEVEFENEI